MASSVAECNSDVFFLWGHVKVHAYTVPPRNIEELVARLQVAVATVDVNMLRRVRENGALTSALKWREVSFNICYD
jgi:hypothetical protein